MVIRKKKKARLEMQKKAECATAMAIERVRVERYKVSSKLTALAFVSIALCLLRVIVVFQYSAGRLPTRVSQEEGCKSAQQCEHEREKNFHSKSIISYLVIMYAVGAIDSTLMYSLLC
jgi:hypothetical protein